MNKLARLFDYQKYESNSELAEVIRDVESRYPAKRQALSDDELEFVAAATGQTDNIYLHDDYNKRQRDRRPKT